MVIYRWWIWKGREHARCSTISAGGSNCVNNSKSKVQTPDLLIYVFHIFKCSGIYGTWYQLWELVQLLKRREHNIYICVCYRFYMILALYGIYRSGHLINKSSAQAGLVTQIADCAHTSRPEVFGPAAGRTPNRPAAIRSMHVTADYNKCAPRSYKWNSAHRSSCM